MYNKSMTATRRSVTAKSMTAKVKLTVTAMTAMATNDNGPEISPWRPHGGL